MKAEDVAAWLEGCGLVQSSYVRAERYDEKAAAIRALIADRDALRAEVARLRDRPPVVNLSADDVWELRRKP